jgi:hypothetical protein
MPSHRRTVLGPKTCAAGNNGLLAQGQRSVSTSSRRKADLRRVLRSLHVCQARRAGPWNVTASRAAGQHSNISSGQHHRVHVRSQSGTAVGRGPAGPRVSSEARHWFSSCTGRHQQRGALTVVEAASLQQTATIIVKSANGYNNYLSVQRSATGI